MASGILVGVCLANSWQRVEPELTQLTPSKRSSDEPETSELDKSVTGADGAKEIALQKV